MMKHIFIVALVVVGFLAVSVYRAKLGAQEAERRIEALQVKVSGLEEELAVLRAEEAHLSRPERIGPIARKELGLAPVQPEQMAGEAALEAHLRDLRRVEGVAEQGEVAE